MESHGTAETAASDARTSDEITVVRRVGRSRSAEATRVEVDLDAVVANLHEVQARIGSQTGVLAMLKADAYGHGVVAVSRALEADGLVAGFVVTTVHDALLLRQESLRSPILLMAASFTGSHDDVLEADVEPVLSSASELESFACAARRRGAHASAHVKIDTGMSRLGVREDALEDFLAACRSNPEIVISGLCTHLASADDEPATTTLRQLAAFDRAVALFRAAGHAPIVIHAANTAATYRHPQAHFSHVRTGVALFGGDEASGALLRPTMRLATRVAQLRWLQAGDAVSYGQRWCANRPSRIATLPVGYDHGYPRRLFGKGKVLVRGRPCPIVGAICMEMMLVDVTDLGADVQVGDDVVLIGAQGTEEITAVHLASQIDTIVEEIFCGVSKSVPREYVGRGVAIAPRTTDRRPAVGRSTNPRRLEAVR